MSTADSRPVRTWPGRRAGRPHAAYRAPPLETGERIRTIVRTDDEELRINWALYEEKPYAALWMWTWDRSGRWWPHSKRRLSILGFASWRTSPT